jgi:PAS domain S-box-containing protein
MQMEDLKFQVSRREKVEAEVRELARGLEAKVRRLVEANVVGIVMWSLEGAITGANEAFLRMVQYEREDLACGRIRWTDLTPAEWRGHDEGAIADLKATGIFQPYEKEYFRKDGGRVPVLLGGALLEGDGREGIAFVLDLSEQKRQESARLYSEERYRVVVETASDAVVGIDDTGSIVFANPATATIFGYDPAELAGKPLTLLMPEYMRELHQAGFKRYLATSQRHMNWQGAELTALRKNGEEFPVEVSFGEISRDGHKTFTGFLRDISNRKQAEQALRRSEAFLAEAQHLSHTGSFSWRVATDEITWSEQLYRIYELESSVPVTLELIRTRVHPEDLTLYEQMVEEARNGGNDFEWQYRLLMPDHSIKYMHALAQATRDQDGQLEYIAAVQDVTARRLAEEARDKARSELAHVARMMSLGSLTASIAHELNQPLSGIVTNASTCMRMLAADPPNVDGARETARRTIRDGNRASEMITRLRALFAKKSATTQAMDLNEATREVIALSLSELQKNRVILRPELAHDLPLVTGDRVQLQQVILNLLRNASDAMSTIDDRPRDLLIRTEPDDNDRVRLSVRDVGIGFEPQAADKLFEAFYTTKNEGMGVGLSVSRSIIEHHHGRLWALANNGPGVTFSFSIPCRLEGLADAETPVNRTDLSADAA